MHIHVYIYLLVIGKKSMEKCFSDLFSNLERRRGAPTPNTILMWIASRADKSG